MADQRVGVEGAGGGGGGNAEIARQLAALAERVGAIEARLGMVGRVEVRHESVGVPPPIPVTPPPVPQPTTAVVEGRVYALDELMRRKQEARGEGVGQAVPKAPPIVPGGPVGERQAGVAPLADKPPVAPGLSVPPITHRPVVQKEPFSVEKLIGGKLFAIVGAIIVVIGVGMGIKLMADWGLLRVSPLGRCLMAAGFGFALIGLGELARRKINVMASVGVSAAGVAVVYAAAFAAYGWFNLVGPAMAFVLLVGASLLGMGVALRAKSIAVAALALVAAYVTPLVIGSSGASPLVMPSYLLALLAMGLVLAAWKPDPFRMLRQFVWWGTVLVGSLWMVKTDWAQTWIILVFLGMVWLAIHAALWIGSRVLGESAAIGWAPMTVQRRVTRPVVLSFATTAWTVTMGVVAVQEAAAMFFVPAWAIPAAAVCGTLALAMMLAGNLRVFQDAPETDEERLGAALWIQSGAMLIAAVALGVSNWTQVIAWLGMGVAAAAVGRWLRARPLDVYGIIVLSIAAVRLVVWESWHAGGPAGELVFGLALGRWSVLMAAGGVAWLGAAWLINRPSGAEGTVMSRRRCIGVDLCIAIGLMLVFCGVLSEQSAARSVLAVFGVLGVALAIAAYTRKSLLLEVWGAVVLMLTSLVTFQYQVGVFDRVTPGTSLLGVIWTEWAPVLVWLAAAWWGLAAVGARIGRVSDRVLATGAIGAGVLVLMAALVTEGTHVGMVSAVWVVIGVALVALHGGLRRWWLDVMGLGVLGLSVLAWAYWYLVERSWLEALGPALMYSGLWVAMAIVGAMMGSAWWLRGGTPRRASVWASLAIAVVAATVVLFGATSLEMVRSARVLFPADGTAQAGALSIWWGVFSVGLLVVGFGTRVPIVRHVGLGLLIVAMVKAGIFDVWSAAPVWRVASFIGLGVLMLGVSVAYWKVSKSLEERADRKPEATEGNE